MLSMLTHPHPPPDETPTLPPISALTTPYASAPPPHLLLGLQSLCCCGALKLCLQCGLPSLCAYSARPTCLQHCLPSLRLQCPLDMPPMPLTILTLAVTFRHA
ncbi:hypothetical protein O181_122004 [Austropuccinia psidii MF-1]|uniref:Uncharacterized protein n=1 Tax=Austropuccinia psidii MF-1 TaxID=1389203 RepID=A0A9Q3Q1W9_9BASI|nr:hypothetical protein [Austropuccinia psidii MF-1]